nr:MAG TPA: protein of unknown function DUF603 [Inoviridae sp.]
MAKWHDGKLTAAEAMRQLGMSRSTFYRHATNRK